MQHTKAKGRYIFIFSYSIGIIIRCFSNAEMRQLMTCSQKFSCSIRMQQVEIFSHAMIPLVPSNHTEPLVQERFRYCGAKMLPKGSMGYVEPGQVPPTGGATEAREMLLNLGHG